MRLKSLLTLVKTFPWSGVYPRVLMYHSVGTDLVEGMAAGLRIRPSVLERQVVIAKRLGFEFVTVSELLQRGGRRKKIALTFDDGYLDNFELAYPIIKKHNVRATFFVTRLTNMFSSVPLLCETELRVLADDPRIEIGAHTVNHVLMDQTDDETCREEIVLIKNYVESITGRKCVSFAYPGGHYLEKHKVMLHNAGYDCAVTIERGLHHITDCYHIHRVNVARSYGTVRYLLLLLTGY